MKYFKACLLAVALVFVCQVSKAQVDKRLYSHYSKIEIEQLKHENPKKLEYLNFYVNNIVQVEDMPTGKENDKAIKGTIKVKNIKSPDVYLLGIQPSQTDYQYYKIEGTNKMLVVLSLNQLETAYKKSQEKK